MSEEKINNENTDDHAGIVNELKRDNSELNNQVQLLEKELEKIQKNDDPNKIPDRIDPQKVPSDELVGRLDRNARRKMQFISKFGVQAYLDICQQARRKRARRI